MTTYIITVKSILSRPLNELLGVLNLEQCNGLERRQYGLEGTRVLSKSIALSNIRLLPGPPDPPIMMMHRYGMGETDGIIRLGSGPGGRCNITCHLETIVRGVYNHIGAEVLSGPLHPQKDTVCASGTVCTSNKVGQSNSLDRKEIKHNERDKSVNSVLSEPPHPPKETNSHYDQKDHSSSPDSKTLGCC